MVAIPPINTGTLKGIYTIALLMASFTGNEAAAHSGGLAADGCHFDKGADKSSATSASSRHCHRDAVNTPRIVTEPLYKPTSDKPTSQSNEVRATLASNSDCDDYNRKEWGYKGAKFATQVGFYSGQTCRDIDADHVVSLKDAHESGGCAWTSAKKRSFANDLANLVPSCSKINRSKGAAQPHNFVNLANDGRGVEFDFTKERQCQYLSVYATVKKKYHLAFGADNSLILSACGIAF
ncbi:MAG: HNH endonuclease family protein [Gammaproteobacteria bacterium]|nr:HNH endonuclease family protein [Gammaproteobacteria bacterium]